MWRHFPVFHLYKHHQTILGCFLPTKWKLFLCFLCILHKLSQQCWSSTIGWNMVPLVPPLSCTHLSLLSRKISPNTKCGKTRQTGTEKSTYSFDWCLLSRETTRDCNIISNLIRGEGQLENYTIPGLHWLGSDWHWDRGSKLNTPQPSMILINCKTSQIKITKRAD